MSCQPRRRCGWLIRRKASVSLNAGWSGTGSAWWRSKPRASGTGRSGEAFWRASLRLPSPIPIGFACFAKAQGILAKTDRLDAKVLAMFAAMMAPVCRAPAPEALAVLHELVTARDSAVAEQTALKNQLSATQGAFLKRQLVRRIAQLAVHIKALEAQCLKRIKADAGLARRLAILTSIPGFGAIVAMTLLACLNELGALTDKQVGALAGLAPVADDSGARRGARVIWGGRAPVRRILYLAAVTAARCNTDMKAFHRRLRANGKASKTALIAVARKLVLLANTLIAQDRNWQPSAPKTA